MEFWIPISIMMLIVIAASVIVGLSLKSSRKHKASREEVLALKASGAFKHRKSNR